MPTGLSAPNMSTTPRESKALHFRRKESANGEQRGHCSGISASCGLTARSELQLLQDPRNARVSERHEFASPGVQHEEGQKTLKWIDKYCCGLREYNIRDRHSMLSSETALPYGMDDDGVSIHIAANMPPLIMYATNVLKGMQLPYFSLVFAKHTLAMSAINPSQADATKLHF